MRRVLSICHFPCLSCQLCERQTESTPCRRPESKTITKSTAFAAKQTLGGQAATFAHLLPRPISKAGVQGSLQYPHPDTQICWFMFAVPAATAPMSTGLFWRWHPFPPRAPKIRLTRLINKTVSRGEGSLLKGLCTPTAV